MLQFLNEAIQSPNLPLTVLMIFLAVYWLTVVIGLMDFDFLDFDLDTDFDADIDADLDADLDGGVSGGGVLALLGWFNLGKVPFMILFTIIIFTMWMSSILINYYIGNNSALFGVLLYIPIFFWALFVTKIVSTPLVPLFKKLHFKGEKAINLEGKVCTILLSVKNTETGQAEIVTENKNFIISIASLDGSPIKKGEKAVIIERKEKYYLVQKLAE